MSTFLVQKYIIRKSCVTENKLMVARREGEWEAVKKVKRLKAINW